MAREEVRLTRLGEKDINQRLMKVLPHRSLESIKGQQRTSNKRYQNHLLEFSSEMDVSRPPPLPEDPPLCGTPLGTEDFPEPGRGAVNGFCDVHHESWWAKVKGEIQDFPFLGGLEVDLLKPSCLTEEVRQLIDQDFNLWMESITARNLVGVVPRRRGKRKSGQGQRESTGLQKEVVVVPDGSGRCESGDTNRRRKKPVQNKRKAAYKKMQDLFRRNKARCAQEVLCGGWDQPVRRLSLEELEPFWRKVFEQESEVDVRVVDPIGPCRMGSYRSSHPGRNK